jgi:hypothetical protein
MFFGDVLDRITAGMPDHTDGLNAQASVHLHKVLTETLWRADTLFVTSDMMHILMQAAHDLPADAEFDEHVLITPNGFCLFEEPIIGVDRHDKKILFHGIAWSKQMINRSDSPDVVGDRGMGLIIFFLVDPTDPLDDYNHEYLDLLREKNVSIPPLSLQHFYPTRFGRTVFTDDPEMNVSGTRIVEETLKLFIAMQLIAQQKIGEPVRMRPDRATRRRYEREYGENERLITLITLRRKSVKKDDEEPQKVEWSRRWAVQGHWRRQYYSKSKTHDYVYIHSYIKGPEDKPLVLSDRRVFNFAR